MAALNMLAKERMGLESTLLNNFLFVETTTAIGAVVVFVLRRVMTGVYVVVEEGYVLVIQGYVVARGNYVVPTILSMVYVVYVIVYVADSRLLYVD